MNQAMYWMPTPMGLVPVVPSWPVQSGILQPHVHPGPCMFPQQAAFKQPCGHEQVSKVTEQEAKPQPTPEPAHEKPASEISDLELERIQYRPLFDYMDELFKDANFVNDVESILDFDFLYDLMFSSWEPPGEEVEVEGSISVNEGSTS